MPSHGLSLHVIGVSSAISACEKGSRWVEAFQLLRGMVSWRCLPNEISYNSMLKAAEAAGHWQLVMSLLEEMDKILGADLIAYNTATMVLTASFVNNTSLQCLLNERLPPELLRALRAISGPKRSHGKSTWEINWKPGCSRMKMAQQSPNAAFQAGDWKTPQGFTKRIALCWKVGRWQEAAYLLHRMRILKLVPKDVTCNMVISCFARSSRWQMAIALLADMPAIKAQPDLISHNSAISSCEAAGEWEAALALLETLEDAELQPDVICYSGVISACAKGGFWRLTLALLQRLVAQRMQPDMVCCNSALGAYKGPRWPMAIAMLESFVPAQLTPDVVSFCTAISCCAEAWPSALQLLEMRSLHARLGQDVFGYSSAMSCMSNHASQAWPTTLDLLTDMLSRQLQKRAMDEKHGMLICIYVLQFLTALKLLSELVRIGLKARSDWSRFWKRWRELLGHVQEWQRSDARVNHFFELTLCRLLHSSSQVMLVALFLRLLVVEWHLLYSRTRHDLQPELDLSNALAYGLLLLLCSWPRLVSPESLDAWYVVLQILCTVPLLSTQTADVTMVSLITLLPRFLLGLCCRRVWLAALGAIIYWLLSLRSVLSPEGASNDLPLVQSFELLVFFAGMVALRHQMYENVRVSLSLQKRSIELGAASALLYSFCDAALWSHLV
eukprot:symbB.v1.2.026812.t1/scaffold2712.1/size72561/1